MATALTSSTIGNSVMNSLLQKYEYYDPLPADEVLSSPKFPPPRIDPCNVTKLWIATPSQERIERICIIPSNNQQEIYAIEGNLYKESIYGSVHRGWLVKSSESSCENSAKYHQTSEYFQIAIKKYSKQKISRYQGADDPIQEFSALQYLGNEHENILGQLQCLEDENYYYSIMKYCTGGELYKRIMNDGPLSEESAREIFLQLVSSLEYLQQKQIFHRDISLENILLDSSGQIPYLIDFGMCLRQPHSQTGKVAYLPPMQAKGKKSYMAPEIVSESPINGYAADIWSLGIVLFTLLSGKFIVTYASPLCPLFRYVRGRRLKDMCKQWRLGLSSEAEDLLFHMIMTKPSDRYSLEEIKWHPWCQQGGTARSHVPTC